MKKGYVDDLKRIMALPKDALTPAYVTDGKLQRYERKSEVFYCE
jgi:hypothetical protein